MLTVIGYGVIIVLIASLLAAYALNSVKGSRREQDYDAGVTAAQAGVDYVASLLRGGTNPTTLGKVGWTALAGSTDAGGNSCTTAGLTGANLPSTCPQFKYSTSYDAGSGAVTVYAEGRSRAAVGSNQEVDRAVKVTLRKSDYTDYLYYSQVEAADPKDPVAYPTLFYPSGGPSSCGLQAWANNSAGTTRPASCVVPAWRNNDATGGSTVHSNDLFTTSGSPTFNSQVTTEDPSCQASPSNTTPTCYTSTDGGTPNFQQGAPSYATGSYQVPNNLKGTAVCTYTGPTRIRFVGSQMEVWSPQTQATDNPGQNCGGGLSQNIVDQLNTALHNLGINASFSLSTPLATITASLSSLLSVNLSLTSNVSQLLGYVTSIASTPQLIPIPASIYVRDNDGTPIGTTTQANAIPASGVYCLVGKTLGLYGTLDPDPTALLNNGGLLSNTNPDATCNEGHLFVSGPFNGHTTIGTDGDITIMSDLYYSDAAGDTSAGSPVHDGSSQLGLVAYGDKYGFGFVNVWEPIQCTLALTTCLSLTNKNSSGLFQPLKQLGGDIHIDAAIMSVQHSFGLDLPLPSTAYASLLNLITANTQVAKIDLYGSIYQYYRGSIGANLLSLGVGVLAADASVSTPAGSIVANVGYADHMDVANANIDLGYAANYVYDQHLRSSPPPNFPTPANPTWVQDTFAEIPISKLPAGF
jgi:hypothetical protein